jgi:putative ABC transport system ATP-binding protein
MTLLELERVGKRHPRQAMDDRGSPVLLCEVSLDIDAGEVVGIWGLPGSGRTTLLRIAAGLEAPDEGVVRLHGVDLARAKGDVDGVVYCDPTALTRRAQWFGGTSGLVIEEMLATQLARGVATAGARDRALEALTRTGAESFADVRVGALDGTAAIRVALAQALTSNPAVVIVDEPTRYVDLLQREPILALLRSLADEGLAVLMAIGESTGYYCVDRTLTLGAGRLRGKAVPELAPVLELGRRHSA